MSPLAEMINELLLKNSPRPVVEAAIATEWKEGPVPTREEIDCAYAECVAGWGRTVETDPAKIYAFHIHSRRLLYREAFQARDFRACLAILKDQARLEKAYELQIEKAHEEEKEDREVRQYLEVIRGGKKQGKQSAHNHPAGKAARR